MNEQNQYEQSPTDTLLRWLPKLLTPILLFVLILVVVFKPTEYNVAVTAPTQTTNPTFSPNIIVNNTMPNLTVDLNINNITYNMTGNYTQGNVTNYYTIYNTTNSTISEVAIQTIYDSTGQTSQIRYNQSIPQNITKIWGNISEIDNKIDEINSILCVDLGVCT